MPNLTDDLIDRAALGQKSALVKGEVSRRLSQQEASVLNRAIASFRNGLLTTEQARDAIAQLSALRDFAQALDKEITKGVEAHSHLVSPGPRNGGQR